MPTYSATITDGLGAHDATRPNIATALLDGMKAHAAVPFAGRGQILLSGVGLHLVESHQYQAGAAIVDLLELHEAVTPVGHYRRAINTQLLLHDLLQRGFPALLTSGIGLHDLTKVVQAVAVVSALKLHDTLPGTLTRYAQTLVDRARFHDALTRFLGGGLPVATIGLHDAFTPVYRATARVSEHLALSAILGRSLLFRIDLVDATDFHDADILKMIYRGDHLLDGFRIWASYIDPGGGFITWAINTRTSAVTEYQNYAFNSVCKFGHRYLGADSTGLWTLDGDLDDVMSIPTRIKAGWMQLAGSHFTSFKAAYLGLRTAGASIDFFLKLHAGDGREYVYAVTPQNMRTTKVHMGKGLRSRYFAFELVTDGGDYDLDSIEFVPISTKRRV